MKFNSISLIELKEHLRIEDDYDDVMLESYLSLAKKYILSQTGLTEEQTENKDELAFAVLALAGDFYENRIHSVTIQNKPNPIVESILAMHSVNLL